MATWRFYQGLRTEWRWYHFDEQGGVIAESDQGFAELRGCMANAETAGFRGGVYQVHARPPADENHSLDVSVDPFSTLVPGFESGPSGSAA